MQYEQPNLRSRQILLSEDQATVLLASVGLPLAPSIYVASVNEACEAVNRIGFPVVLKFSSQKYPHKSDIGGVVLNIDDMEKLKNAYVELHQKLSQIDPNGKFYIQPMITDGIEIIVGVTHDQQLGHILMVGSGGIFAEVLKDVKFGLIPIREVDAWRMIRSLKGYPLLEGVRGRKNVDVSALVGIMMAISTLIEERSDVFEVDLNPVIVHEQGALIVDTRIVINDLGI
jgi:acetate---CoA ligase (ADP-forming) subunit beta